MSRFYSSIQGHRGEATRQGYRAINGHIRGWNIGVKVRGYINDQGEDEFEVILTGGSGGPDILRHLGRYSLALLETAERLEHGRSIR